MEPVDSKRTVATNDKNGQEGHANVAPPASGSMTFDAGQVRDSNQFQHLIPNEHIQLPPNPAFGMGHHFVTPFPGYMHAVPSGLYSLNMMEDPTEHQPKRRRRTNYRDPENAAKLTTALGILIKQKEENKPQDLKSIASHFGLPYNTLRDNYLKVTTGKLLKDKSEKKQESDRPKPKKGTTSGRSSTNNSAVNTPRDPPATSAPITTGHTMAYTGMPGMPAGAPFGPYPMYHPSMGMFMPSMMPAAMPHMQNVQVMSQQQQQPQQSQQQSQQQPMQSAAMAAPGMHPMLSGAPQMMHIYAGPMGYQMNPATGRPFPMFGQAPNGEIPQMQQPITSGAPGGQTGGAGAGGEQASPHTPHTPHMLAPVYVSAMPPGSMPQGMPMFNPAMFATAPMMDHSAAGAQQQQSPHHAPQNHAQAMPSTGFSLLLPGHTTYAPAQQTHTSGGTPSASNAPYLAAPLPVNYADGVTGPGSAQAQGQGQQQQVSVPSSSGSGSGNAATGGVSANAALPTASESARGDNGQSAGGGREKEVNATEHHGSSASGASPSHSNNNRKDRR